MTQCLDQSTDRKCISTQIFAPPTTPITLYRCQLIRTDISTKGEEITKNIRVSRKQCKNVIISRKFKGHPLRRLPNNVSWEISTKHPWLSITPWFKFQIYKKKALLLGPIPMLDQTFIQRQCHYYNYRCRSSPNAPDIWMWAHKKTPQDGYTYVGTRRAFLVNNETLIVPTLRLISHITSPHQREFTGQKGHYFGHVRNASCPPLTSEQPPVTSPMWQKTTLKPTTSVSLHHYYTSYLNPTYHTNTFAYPTTPRTTPTTQRLTPTNRNHYRITTSYPSMNTSHNPRSYRPSPPVNTGNYPTTRPKNASSLNEA